MIADFTSEVIKARKARKKCHSNFQVLKETYKHKLYYLGNLSNKNEGKRETFSDKRKPGDFITSTHIPKEYQKEIPKMRMTITRRYGTSRIWENRIGKNSGKYNGLSFPS